MTCRIGSSSDNDSRPNHNPEVRSKRQDILRAGQDRQLGDNLTIEFTLP